MGKFKQEIDLLNPLSVGSKFEKCSLREIAPEQHDVGVMTFTTPPAQEIQEERIDSNEISESD